MVAATAAGGGGAVSLVLARSKLEGKTTFYQIVCTVTGGTGAATEVWRRYSEFDALRTQLIKGSSKPQAQQVRPALGTLTSGQPACNISPPRDAGPGRSKHCRFQKRRRSRAARPEWWRAGLFRCRTVV